jgi:DUF1365 family protein
MSVSALYDGVVVHQRHAPRRHRLRYRLFQMLLDLDEAPGLDRRLRLFGFNRFGLFSFHERDHLAGDGRPLRDQIDTLLAAEGVEARGAVQILCLPRVLGYVFNPLSLYYCHSTAGDLAAVILEVNNTFGERHCYVMRGGGPVIRGSWQKSFFVSPFLDLDMVYDARLLAPADEVETLIVGRRSTGESLITASFAGQRRELSDLALGAALLRHPLVTLKVVAAIHLEAAKLLCKGVQLHQRPVPGIRGGRLGRRSTAGSRA